MVNETNWNGFKSDKMVVGIGKILRTFWLKWEQKRGTSEIKRPFLKGKINEKVFEIDTNDPVKRESGGEKGSLFPRQWAYPL